MSRTIKFRVWDKERFRWGREYDERLEDLEDPAYEKEYGEDSGWLDGDVASDLDLVNGRLAIGRYAWEQFTGLLDRNGKKIYEGDLMRLSSTKAPALKGRNLVVKFDEFDIGEYNCQKMVGWMVEVVDNDWEWASSLSDVVSFCEVIGNIHEPIDKSNQV